MSTSVIVSKLPECDIHLHDRNEHVIASYDGKTVMGPWANMCEDCFREYGIGLGTGKGQLLILK